MEKSSFICVFLQSSWFKLLYWSAGISDIVTYCLVDYCWVKIQNKVAVLNVWVQTNLKKTCPNVNPTVKDLPESKIVTVTQNLIISRMHTWGTGDSWWVSLTVVAITFVCNSQLLGDNCHNLTYRNMHLPKYHWALFILVQKFFAENDKRENKLSLVCHG